MGSIIVPPRVAAAIWRRQLVAETLKLIHKHDAVGCPLERLKAWFQYTCATGGHPLSEADRVMTELLREKLVRTDGVTYWIGNLADLRAYMAKSASPAAPEVAA